MKTQTIEPLRTIAIIEHKGRTFYLDIMPNGRYTIHLDEFIYNKPNDFKKAWELFEQIATIRKEEIQKL